MADVFLGQICIFSFNFAPRSFAQCNGQLMPINQNQALFALLGTTYGGDGRQTYALPNLAGRAALSFGQGPGLSDYSIGQKGGEAAHTLAAAELPQHTHPAHFASDTTALGPGGHYWAQDMAGNVTYSTTHNAALSGNAITASGNGQPHPNQQPYLVVNFCIALQGIFPTSS